eukprot:GHVT01011393.1.p1 GENE.GHVT01011393.1~~GHVT01011393.1.p1  ORF type:complete len:300 (-),score=57.37 GHVT01011393.1:163-1062(-)
MTVRTTKKTWDPFMIIKARDMMKLLARSVPFPQARRILEDGVFCDIVKIGGITRNKERFVKRRQRLVGPNGSSLKALELLTDCYILVQGQTVAIVGAIKGIKVARRVVEDCLKNIHPVYHIKELMIRRELEKDESLKNEEWARFLPQFKKRNSQRKQRKKLVKSAKKKQSLKSPFPPERQPSKIDKLIESGEYFVQEEERKIMKQKKRKEEQLEKTLEKKRLRGQVFLPPVKKEKPQEPAAKRQKSRHEPQGQRPHMGTGPSKNEAQVVALATASKLVQHAKATTSKQAKRRTAQDLLL